VVARPAAVTICPGFPGWVECLVTISPDLVTFQWLGTTEGA
jgi:hypothetical protein